MFSKLLLVSVVVQLVLTSVVAQSSSPDRRNGSINGSVKEESATLVPRIEVLAQSKPNASIVSRTRTDANGRFQMVLEFGEYSVLATDEKENYADCRLPLFWCDVQDVAVKPDSPAIN